MQDLPSKIALLAYYIECIAQIACTIPDEYLARLYGRSLFLGVDSFVKLAPALKNELRRAGTLSQSAADHLKEQIKKLTSDYEGYYTTVRDKFAAHQQEVDLVLLVEAWNEIDEATLRLLAADVADVWRALEAGGAVSTFARPTELDDGSLSHAFSGFVPDGVPRVGVDRVAMTRPNTVSMIPTGIFQEKGMRVVTAVEGFRILINSGLEQVTSRWYLPEKARIDLLVVDACSLLDNVFTARSASAATPAEDSLIKMWQDLGVKGAPTLAQFSRDLAFEGQLRELRNKVSAHLDSAAPLSDLRRMLETFPLDSLVRYVERLWRAFNDACFEDIRTRPFLIQGQQLRGVVSVVETDAVKRFR